MDNSVKNAIVNQLVAQLTPQGISVTEIEPNTRVEHCLDAPRQSYSLGDRGRLHFYTYPDENAARNAASSVPADGDCGPIDWAIDVQYYRCGQLIAFLTSQDPTARNALEDMCGVPFAIARQRF